MSLTGVVWVPGEAEPTIADSRGLTRLEVEEQPGGWRVIACANGEYALATDG
ncbi:hypothetical protein [Agromyces sp. Leaf222]|uniref:hypothetical protein n=1 Tax=Agromyces sp. Leaf222 TaxID=1735688 RepID=UPI000B167F8E|nr:hypothetical protein [Agromyces sp. Leaf222]